MDDETYINPPEHEHHMLPPETNTKEYSKLLGIILFLALSAVLASTVNGFNFEEWMRWFMGGFFLVFGAFKLIGYEMFIIMFPSYNPIAKRYKLYAYLYPFIEIFLGFLYMAGIWGLFRDIVTLVLLSIGVYGISKTIARQGPVQCACLGNVIKLPLSTVSLIEDVSMAAMALLLIVMAFAL